MKILNSMIKESSNKVRVTYEAVEYASSRCYSELIKEVEVLEFYLDKLKNSLLEKNEVNIIQNDE
jgi:hypothetical protein